MTNPFILEREAYKREIDPVQQYANMACSFLSMNTGKTTDESKAFLAKVMKGEIVIPSRPGQLGIRDPKITYLLRNPDTGDREAVEGTLLNYLKESIAEAELIAPTFTTYVNPKVNESLLVAYVEDNVKARGVAKKASFAAKEAKEYFLAAIKNIEQTNKKLSNNAVSGAHVSASTPLFNRTAHSTLTSCCRSTSGYGNANNEKFLCGNRHYWSPDIVINNIISIITHIDWIEFTEFAKHYKLTEITPEQAMDVVLYSTKLYWSDIKREAEILSFLQKLPTQALQMFVYVGDLHHLKKFNPDLVRTFIDKLSSKIVATLENKPSDPEKILKETEEDSVYLAHQICSTEMKGKGKDYKKMAGTRELDTLALTTQHITDTLNVYRRLISNLWVTDNVPASMAYFPESIRRAALTSDTDSTIFTVQDWIEWHQGCIAFDDKATAVAATMIFLASQTITHVLAKMSANFGIEPKRLHQIAMKNEFKFDVFTPTQVAKHYFAAISCQEGNVKENLEYEIKGVHLKSSNAPAKITKAATDLMIEIMTTVMAGEKISILKILTDIANIERSIEVSIKSGSLEYFRLAQIKTPDSYKSVGGASPYGHHVMWEEVFASKYGSIAEPPYGAIKVSTTLTNPTAIKQWLESIQDKDLAIRLQKWMLTNNKTVLPTLLLSTEVVRDKGIPIEIVQVINIRNMLSDLTRIFYLILETLGYYISDSKNTRMCMDFY